MRCSLIKFNYHFLMVEYAILYIFANLDFGMVLLIYISQHELLCSRCVASVLRRTSSRMKMPYSVD